MCCMCVCLYQGFIVASPQLSSTTGLIAPLGSQYPPGTKFAIVPGKVAYDINNSLKYLGDTPDLTFCAFDFSAGQQQLFQQVAPSTVNAVIPGVIHRPQVQQITKNIVTLANVQSPVMFSTHSNLTQPNRSNSQALQTISVPAVGNSNTKGK